MSAGKSTYEGAGQVSTAAETGWSGGQAEDDRRCAQTVMPGCAEKIRRRRQTQVSQVMPKQTCQAEVGKRRTMRRRASRHLQGKAERRYKGYEWLDPYGVTGGTWLVD